MFSNKQAQIVDSKRKSIEETIDNVNCKGFICFNENANYALVNETLKSRKHGLMMMDLEALVNE